MDHDLTGTDRARPGLREAPAFCWSGHLVVTDLGLARSLTDARSFVAELTGADVKPAIGGSGHDPTNPVVRLLLTTLRIMVETEDRHLLVAGVAMAADLDPVRTRLGRVRRTRRPGR